MRIYSRIKQYYKYRRNWRKLQSRQAKGKEAEQLSKELNFYSQLINKGDFCFDIGANIGDKTDMFVRLDATVVAVEPQESCWRVLKRRFKNGNVSIETAALAGEKGSRTLFIDRSHTLATMSRDWITAVKKSGRFSSHKWADKLPVQTTTLDLLIEKYRKPDFCKIDVEGGEYEVLQGLSVPIKTISLEFVTERIEPTLNCIDYLSRLGKAQFNYCLGGSMTFALPNWADCHKIKQVLSTMNKHIDNYGDLYVRFADEQSPR